MAKSQTDPLLAGLQRAHARRHANNVEHKPVAGGADSQADVSDESPDEGETDETPDEEIQEESPEILSDIKATENVDLPIQTETTIEADRRSVTDWLFRR